MQPIVQRISVYPLQIPMRTRVSHATSERAVADPIIVAVEFLGGAIGYGETLPRPYVTGETVESVLAAIGNEFAEALIGFRPDSFAGALESIDALPWRDREGRALPAARAAIELAILDGMMRYYHRDMDAVVSWMGLPRFGTPGSSRTVRFSGVLAAKDPAQTLRKLRKMYWGGLRQFKLKVGFPGDVEHLSAVLNYLRRPLKKGKVSLRLDANGAWSTGDAIDWLQALPEGVVDGVEQPLPVGQDEELKVLRSAVDLCIVHDESLILMDDARRLIEMGVAGGFNIRISKCGGLMPALRLASLAHRHQVRIQLGCMVGETSILSAAGLRFLQVVPGVTWAEGSFGRFLLSDDVTTPSIRFGYGGRPAQHRGDGLGVRPLDSKLARYSAHEPIVLNL